MSAETTEVTTNSLHSFICYWDLLSEDYCQQIINLFHASEGKRQGHLGLGEINTRLKDSTDLGIPLNDIPDLLLPALHALSYSVNKYIERFPILNNSEVFGLTDGINIQHYKPMSAYWAAHSERATFSTSHRYLVWMIYLNTVNDGGGTRFLYQDAKVDAKAGRIVIWPTDWTHAHQGIPASNEDKYIMTGWFGFEKV